MCSVVPDITVIGGEPVVITSPNYPGYYPPSKAAGQCTVKLTPPANRRDLQAIVAFLDMEPPQASSSICYDKLILEEPGNTAKHNEYCGDAFHTTGNAKSILVEELECLMVTDQDTNRKGFVVFVKGKFTCTIESKHNWHYAYTLCTLVNNILHHYNVILYKHT